MATAYVPVNDSFLSFLPSASLSHLHRVGEQLSPSLVCDSVVSVMVLNIYGGMFSVFFYFKFCFVLLF